MVLVLVLAAAFVYLRVSNDLNTAIQESVRSRADDLAALVASSGTEPIRLGGRRLADSEENFSQVLATDGRVIASTLPPGAAPVLTPAETERARSGAVLIDERDVPGIEASATIVARPAKGARPAAGAQPTIVVAGASRGDRGETLAGLRKAFLIGAPLALILASGLGYLLARSSLAPVEAMRRRADEITLERSGERLPLPGAEDEIHQLGETLNTMLDRIEGSLQRERVFVADASHELRTPLAILSSELELADRPGRTPEQLQGALRSARDEVERLSQLADDLLVIASSDQGSLAIVREPVELHTLLERVRERFARRASKEGREIVVTAPAGETAMLDPVRMEQALANLVDNALRHGEGDVRLSGARDGERLSFEVSDEGAGFAPEFEPRAFERFTRHDGGRSSEGSGLGLAIARAIAEAHGGDASIAGAGGRAAAVRLTVSL